ncbi:hypothetical protein SAMN02745121_06567 [Nannocystis exedens]|uniref:Outer membrane protein beta-barrel domain-containing protein n=1 Tax=Nannocystis exedens TaxID=54 RepID=A0A1I2FER8_9BACT|nr:hypothetical protein [Nannocystis exedens]PCC70514.1 Agglutinin receptor precursor [Nannocystis exedens]SFF03016.1 hypothetical protein SAMN02745121_06567 [Nannocystis exedens]
MRRTVVLTALVALAMPVQAARADDDDRPFRRGTILPSFSLGGSFSRNYGGSLLVGAGASYFVAGGFAVGLHLRNVTTFYSQYFKEQVGPDIFAKIPTNEFSLTPSLLWVIYRGERAAPYLSFGVGPVFLNKQRGVLGQWTVGPGVMIRAGGSLWLDLGLGLGMRFTKDRCQDAYNYLDPITDYACSFTWGFRAGLVFGLGGRRQAQPSQPSPPAQYNPPPASSYPAPAQPGPNASPPPAPAAPVQAPPETPPQPATPPPTPVETPTPENSPPAAPPPATTPTETSPVPPPGENLPVPPPA